MVGKRYIKDYEGKIRGWVSVPFVEIPENFEIKSIKSSCIIKSQIPAINCSPNIINKEVFKLYNLSFMYLNYASEREDYEKVRLKPNHSINVTVEQVGSYLCCLSIELLLKAFLYKQKGSLKLDGNNKVVHSIKKNWESINNINFKEKYNKFIDEVDEIYGNSGEKLRYNQSINGENFNNYKFDYKTLLNNTKCLFNDCKNIIFEE